MPQYRTNTLYLICTSCGLVGSFGLVFASLFSLASATKTAPERSSHLPAELVEMLGRSPILVEFDRMAIDLPCDREEINRYISLLAAPGPTESGSPSRSRKFHTGRLVAISGGTPEWIVKSQPNEVISVNLGSKDFLSTWRGLEAAAMANGRRSEHRDQTLCTLAELDVPLNCTIETREGSLPVADLLTTSISEFHLDQKEISWTVSAFASYLPPQTGWWNRYGEEYSFDTVVQEMMGRKLNRESCRGLHQVMALTKILRIDRKGTILAPEVREALNAYLHGKLAEAVESQLEDGSWPPLWSRSGFSDVYEYTPEDSNVNRVLVTGHMLEWFHMLPKDIKPPIDVVQAGSLWVLDNLRSVPEETVNNHFCPYTHAVLSLYIARFLDNDQHGT
ncbi:hypothetical protein [Gimesia panareensis]|uniref:hypothetical protein n=1 Tax=Gimesia panareensis TaxID=2527978 RepID=UPI00118A40C5|nr:hypothetical protein [Gimesia panareensis]QDU49320.1 hypothetical protein Pan110_16390 [Gimesia panareensis]